LASTRIETRSDLEQFIAADLRMLRLTRWRWHYRLTTPIAHFQRRLRISEYRTNVARGRAAHEALAAISRLRTRRLGHRLGFSIPVNVFGPGLSIAHVGTIVVNSRTRVGRNCRLSHMVTLGESFGHQSVLGDDVHIAPHVAVIAATVGDNCFLLTGAVVTADVPDDSDAGGVPARVIRTMPGRAPWWENWWGDERAAGAAPTDDAALPRPGSALPPRS
jgi:serine O-acetyltransferase